MADRLHTTLKQATELQFEIEHLPAELRNAPEMQELLQQIKKVACLQSVGGLASQFQKVCRDIRQRFEKEKLDAEYQARQEAEKFMAEEAEKLKKIEEARERQEAWQREEASKKEDAEKRREIYLLLMAIGGIFVLLVVN